MIKKFVLATVALFLFSTVNAESTFYQTEIEIPAGISKLYAEMPWNSVALFSPHGEEIPKIYYKNEEGDFLPWYADDEDFSYLELLHTGKVQNSITIKSAETVRLVAHFFNTSRPQKKTTHLVATAGTLADFSNLILISATFKYNPIKVLYACPSPASRIFV